MTWSLADGLENRVVLVTGAAGGVGRALCVAFAEVGSRVAAADVRAPELENVVASLPDDARHVGLVTDLRSPAAAATLVEDVVASLGALDVLVHTAAVIVRRNDVMDVTIDDWSLQEEVNLRATFLLDRAAGARMKAQGGGGRIVNFTSQAWWTGGLSGSLVYAATKGGVVSLTRGFARTFARDGITVNAIALGFVDTPMLRTGVSEETLASFRDQVPLGRIAEPDDVVGSVLFLASKHAAYVTGTTLNATGGQLAY